jgi:hypothetical protein
MIALAGTVAAQVNWNNRTPASGPMPRSNPGITFDIAHGNTVLFGGYDNTISQADTWTWNGTAWTQMTPAASPLGRDYHAMCYDLGRNRTVLFGGWDTNGTPQGDTWEWDGTNWTQVVTAASPSARYGVRMSYDLARAKVVLFGGYDNVSTFGDTWEYDGTNWTQITTATTPTVRDSHGQAYDVARNRTVIFGGWDANGVPLSDTWTYDGTNWTMMVPSSAPSARTFVQMSYDLTRNVTVLFGGTDLGTLNNFADTWEWNGTNWTSASPVTVPGSRDSYATTFDIARGQLVLFGGIDSNLALTNQLWEYGGSGGTAASWSAFGSGCMGSAGVPAMAPVTGSLPRLNSNFQLRVTNLPAPGVIYMVFGFSNTAWNSLPLPMALGTFGMPGCTGYVSVNSGVVVVGSGGAATWSLSIPNNPAFTGINFYNQAISIDPAAGNPAGATVSNAGHAIVGT